MFDTDLQINYETSIETDYYTVFHNPNFDENHEHEYYVYDHNTNELSMLENEDEVKLVTDNLDKINHYFYYNVTKKAYQLLTVNKSDFISDIRFSNNQVVEFKDDMYISHNGNLIIKSN